MSEANDNLRMFRGPPPRRSTARAEALANGGGGGDSTGMEPRIAVLEQIAKSTDAVLKELKDDVREMRRDQRTDFRLTWGAVIFVALGLAAMMAKGFKWI